MDIDILIDTYQFLVGDYHFTQEKSKSKNEVKYRNKYEILCSLDKIDGLNIIVKPIFITSSSSMSILHVAEYLSNGKFISEKINFEKWITLSTTEQANYYKQIILRYCQPLLLGDTKWWMGALRGLKRKIAKKYPLSSNEIKEEILKNIQKYSYLIKNK